MSRRLRERLASGQGRAHRALGAGTVVSYEDRLAKDSRWALSEGSRYFEGSSALQDALRKIAKRLDGLGIPYAVAGGLALFAHGFRRFTDDVDILVSPAGLTKIHQELEGLGYVPLFEGSKNLRDADLGVRIEFLVSGQYPGDGKPKPVAFPEPEEPVIDLDGIRYLNLPKLVELKLASGMTNPERIKDLADVQELIKLLHLPADFAEKLNPYVQTKFKELWTGVRKVPKRYIKPWKIDSLAARPESIDELIVRLPDAAALLEAMRADGVMLDSNAGAQDALHLVTTDPDVAQKYDMHEESEFFRETDTKNGHD